MPSLTPTVQPTLAEGAPLPVAEGVHPGSAQVGNTSQTEADNSVQLVNSVDADEPVEANDEVVRSHTALPQLKPLIHLF